MRTIDANGIVMLLGPKQTPTRVTWRIFEGILPYLQDGDWVEFGATRDVRGNPGTLDGYLKDSLNRSAANYIAVILERAGLVELDRERPMRVRLRGGAAS